MDENARKIIEAAEKLQKGIDQQLQETQDSDEYLLEEYSQIYGETSQKAAEVMQAQYRQRLRSVRSNPQFVAKLKRRGLTPEKFLALQDSNPTAYAQAYNQGEDNYLDMLQGKGKKGEDQFLGTGQMVRPTEAQKARAKAIAEKGKGDDKMIDDILWELLP